MAGGPNSTFEGDDATSPPTTAVGGAGDNNTLSPVLSPTSDTEHTTGILTLLTIFTVFVLKYQKLSSHEFSVVIKHCDCSSFINTALLYFLFFWCSFFKDFALSLGVPLLPRYYQYGRLRESWGRFWGNLVGYGRILVCILRWILRNLESLKISSFKINIFFFSILQQVITHLMGKKPTEIAHFPKEKATPVKRQIPKWPRHVRRKRRNPDCGRLPSWRKRKRTKRRKNKRKNPTPKTLPDPNFFWPIIVSFYLLQISP